MNTLDVLIPEDHVFIGVRVPDKTALLRELGRRVGAILDLPAAGIVAALAAREALGSTGVGAGIAVPHTRLSTLAATIAFLVKLERPVEYAAIDGRPVDLMFLLLAPAHAHTEHLAVLSAATRRLRNRAVADALRRAGDATSLRARFVAEPPA